MDRIRKALDKCLNVLAGGSLLAIVALTVWQVFTRYILKHPSSWSEELVAYLFAWTSLLGAVLVTGERGHMNVPILTDRLGEKGQLILLVFSDIIAFIFSLVILVYGGIRITELAMGQMTSALGVKVGVFYVILPIAGVLNMAYIILNIIDLVRNGLPAKEE